MGTRAEDSLIGQTLDGRYRIEKILGVGGMGAVYRARHVHFDTPVAVKVMRSSEVDAARRFLAEARRTFRLKHENCVEVSDCGMVDGGALLYLTMELLEGRTLGEELERDGPMDPFRVSHIGAQIAAAVGAAHELGYVHRDIKPDNIMLVHRGSDPDFVKVLDFGLAKLYDTARLENTRSVMSFTQDGMIFGTPHYMSPEQAQGQRLDPRSDLYSLGVVLYEALAGRVPFDSEAQVEILIAHVKESPRKLTSLRRGLPPALVALVHELLRKKPDERPQSAAQVSSALRSLDDTVTTTGRLSPKLAASETVQLPSVPPGAVTMPSSPPSMPPRTVPMGSVPPGLAPPPHPPPSIPPEVPTASPGAPTALTPSVPTEATSTGSAPRVLLAAALVVLFGAGAFLAWALTRQDDGAAAPAIDAAAPVIDAAAPAIDAAALPAVDAAVAPSAADAAPEPPESIDAGSGGQRPSLTAKQRQARALMRRWRETSSPLRKMALAQQAFEADPTYSDARFAFADALLGTGVPKNRTRACTLLRRYKSRYRRAGCGD